MRIAIIIGFMALCCGCATYSVSYDFDQSYNFASLKTYDWMPVPEKTPGNELTIKHVKYALTRELQAKGFTLSGEKPDLLIAIHGGTQKKIDVQEWGYVYGDHDYYHGRPGHPWGFPRDTYRPERYDYRSGVDTYEYEVGTLVVDIIDAKKKELIWRGTAEGVVDPGRTAEQINEVIREMMEGFPPPVKK